MTARPLPPPEVLAWAAGFVDGEGHLYLRFTKAPGRGRHLVQVTVTNTVRRPLDELQEHFGGSVYEIRVQVGRVSCWQWKLVGARGIRPCLEAIRPYMRVKGEQADIMLRFCALIRPRCGGGPTPLENIAERDVLTDQMAALSVRARPRSTYVRSA